MLGCSDGKLSEKDVECLINNKLREFSKTFETKLIELDEVFQDVEARQGRIEHDNRQLKIEAKQMMEKSTEILKTHLVDLFKNVGKDFEAKSSVRENLFEQEFRKLSSKIDSLEVTLLRETERIDKLENISGREVIDDDGKENNKNNDTENKIDCLNDPLDDLKMNMESVHDLMNDCEASRRNNLIFYGVTQDDRESSKSLTLKIKNILNNKLKVNRFIPVAGACRIFSGPEVHNCQPVVVTFEEVTDRDEILKLSKIKRYPGFSISEDLSKKTREARLELRKFMRELKRKNPEKNCLMEKEKLFVDEKTFVYDEVQHKVVESKEEQTSANSFIQKSPHKKYSSRENLSGRVKHLENLIKKQMMMIQEQQTIIERQKKLLRKERNNVRRNIDNKLLEEESLEDLIDREENSEEDDLFL